MRSCVTGADPGAALILLAAGKSSRFGSDKFAARLDGKPLWRWAVSAANRAGFTRKFLVVRPGRCGLDPGEDWTIVVNRDADLGLSRSIRAGVLAAAGCPRIVLALADMPFVTAGHLAAVAASSDVIFTRYPDGRNGCPAAFPSNAYPALLALSGDRGAASIRFPGSRTMAPDDPAILRDIDTVSDLERSRLPGRMKTGVS